ncbi:MAG: thioredoxin family protein [Bacteroidales bacterium]|nr:thioredoxin family protein [Bacteroidales bacterium]
MDYKDVITSAPRVLVEFYASWCPHCQRMMPVVEQVKEQVKGKVDIYQFDIDKQEELADQERVESIPTFILYNDGKEVWRDSGEITAEALWTRIMA